MACEQEMVDRKYRPKIPQIEVVNEIQILNKKDNQRSSANRSKSKSNKETNEEEIVVIKIKSQHPNRKVTIAKAIIVNTKLRRQIPTK
jgi:hypothetical protein